MRSWLQKGREREGSLSEINPPTALTRKYSSGYALRSLPQQVRSSRRDLMAIRLTCCWNGRSEEHTSELQSLMRISYAVFCLKKKNLQYLIMSITTEQQ